MQIEDVRRGAITPEMRVSARARMELTSDLPTAARNADLLSEAAPLDPGLKGCVLAKFNAACGFYTYPDPAYAQPGFIESPDA